MVNLRSLKHVHLYQKVVCTFTFIVLLWGVFGAITRAHAGTILDLYAPLFDNGPTGLAVVAAAVGDGADELFTSSAQKRQLAIAPWPTRPHHFIVALFELAEDASDESQQVMITTAVLRIKEKSIKLVAYGEEHIDHGSSKSEIAIDPTLYRIRKNETAFGVRVANTTDANGEIFEETVLRLYRIMGVDVAPIFQGLVEQSHRSNATRTVLSANLSMGKSQTRGFYDFTLTSTEHDEPGSANAAANPQVEQERFRWNGYEYTRARQQIKNVKRIKKKVKRKKRRRH